MSSSTLSVAVCVSLALIATACSDAGGTPSGGEPAWDGAAGASPDASSAESTCPSGSGGCTWTALYRDYFGPSGIASCSGSGTCHGAANQLGASYFLCPTNDQTGCYHGMTSTQSALLPPGKSWSQTPLYTALRKAGGGGLMPKQPTTVVFSDRDLARIGAWYAAGTPND